MKKIALISTFCDTEEKQIILYENVLKLKNLNIDVLALGPNFIQLPTHITEACDYFFYTKDNPILEWPVRAYSHWLEFPHKEEILHMERCLGDYGWAALYQTKKLAQIALTFDYDIFYHLIYDVDIDDNIIEELKSNDVNIIHPRENPNNPGEIWETTLHFMVFDRIMLEKIEKEIQLDEYLRTEGVAEGEVLKWKNKFNIPTSGHLVTDKIFYWSGFDFFDYAIFEGFKIFIGKEDNTNLRIVFHSFNNNKKITIEINGESKEYEIIPKDYIEFPYLPKDIKQIKFKYLDNEVDFTKQYEGIMRNQIYYNTKS
tara:strand:- start:866 stop:1807 length:942 start_codon:yes stop_codon:yes gene_type:complete